MLGGSSGHLVPELLSFLLVWWFSIYPTSCSLLAENRQPSVANPPASEPRILLALRRARGGLVPRLDAMQPLADAREPWLILFCFAFSFFKLGLCPQTLEGVPRESHRPCRTNDAFSVYPSIGTAIVAVVRDNKLAIFDVSLRRLVSS